MKLVSKYRLEYQEGEIARQGKRITELEKEIRDYKSRTDSLQSSFNSLTTRHIREDYSGHPMPNLWHFDGVINGILETLGLEEVPPDGFGWSVRKKIKPQKTKDNGK